ncbi:alginate lyase-domain-containing protein [Cerioporus squamosus]|nr:alginate lyase-domain-containing protein [Cerioporus squamosus]
MRSRFAFHSLFPLVLVATAGLVVADSNDWINVNYVLKQANSSSTSGARQNILSKASSSATSGPWSIVNKSSVKPPSGDVHDYLSWAPYHWPDCNWCSKGTNHLSAPSQSGNSTDDDDDDQDDDDGSLDGTDPYENGGDDDYELLAAEVALVHRALGTVQVHSGRAHHRMLRRRRPLLGHGTPGNVVQARQDVGNAQLSPTAVVSSLPTGALSSVPTGGSLSVPTSTRLPGGQLTSSSSRTTSDRTISGTLAPAQGAAKTSKAGSKCTPSPSKTLAPSATWTTCPYVVHDGKANPDVRSLPDSPAAVAMAQAVLYNALAFAFKKTSSYSKNAANYIDTFFLAPATAMNPNMNYGQQVRGPGKEHQMGSYTGILDMRGLVKVTNAIALMKAAGSPDWTSARDKSMTDWMKSYVSWLQNSALGKDVASKANNHLSFFVSQLTAAQMYLGDTKGAQSTLKNYFSHQFLDQIAASGEQPFEAVRTRPYHYRCFNLEAMITNAKLGDQLGMNFWTAKSRYGATIQTALDYVMAQDPKGEDISDIFPHVAAVAAAYGDPKGKYAAFLQMKDSDYKNQPFWFYDQSAALPNSPAGHSKRDLSLSDFALEEQNLVTQFNATTGTVLDAASAAGSEFDCPSVLDNGVELEVGLYVTCDQLKPFYKTIRVPDAL